MPLVLSSAVLFVLIVPGASAQTAPPRDLLAGAGQGKGGAQAGRQSDIPGTRPSVVENKRGIKSSNLPPPPGIARNPRPTPSAAALPPTANRAATRPGTPVGAPRPRAGKPGAYVVLGSFRDAGQAQCFARNLTGWDTGVAAVDVSGARRYRVVAAGRDRAAAGTLRDRARADGVTGAWIASACSGEAAGHGRCIRPALVTPASDGAAVPCGDATAGRS